MRPRPSCHDCIEALRDIDPAVTVRVTSRERTAEVQRYRSPLYAACRALGCSFPEIGRALSRDHTTVLQGVNRFRRVQAGREPSAEFEAALFRAIIDRANERAERRAKVNTCATGSDNVVRLRA